MTAPPPLFWIKQISSSLEEIKEIPLWGFPPPFPLEECSRKIADVLPLGDVKISIENIQLRAASETTSGFGINPLSIAIELTPLGEPVYFLMALEDVRKLCTAALLAQANGKGFSTPAFQEGFYRFLALQIIETIDQLNPIGDLSMKLASQRQLPMKEALCIDISIGMPKMTLWGRLICSHAFRHAFKAHFSRAPAAFLANSPLSKQIDLFLHVEIGQTSLLLSQWNNIKVGDFILLDHCSFDPLSQRGTALLSLNSMPLLRARFKENNLKIIDYAFYQEELMNENENFSDEEGPSGSEMQPENNNHLLSSQNSENSMENLISSHDIQLSLTVEVARLKINLEKLLQLKPGNVLELAVRPEQGVDISIGGKKMAKAELLKLGDVLGVKILHLGD